MTGLGAMLGQSVLKSEDHVGSGNVLLEDHQRTGTSSSKCSDNFTATVLSKFPTEQSFDPQQLR